MDKLPADFFNRDVLEVAPDLLGKTIYRKLPDQSLIHFTITDVEAYRGEEDLACHASKGRTKRTEVMYWEAGHIYVYLIYGIHFMLNFVCEIKDNPQAILIRGIQGIDGPGRVAKALNINMDLNKTNLNDRTDLWIEDSEQKVTYTTTARVGIDYAGPVWKNKRWRFILNE